MRFIVKGRLPGTPYLQVDPEDGLLSWTRLRSEATCFDDEPAAWDAIRRVFQETHEADKADPRCVPLRRR